MCWVEEPCQGALTLPVNALPSAPGSLRASGHPEALYLLPKQVAVEPLLVIPLVYKKPDFS